MYKIKLFCNAGMSTSILVKKMRQAAETKNIDAEIAAYSARTVEQEVKDCDVILLGPQVSFMKAGIIEKTAAYHVPVADIDSYDYGMGNGAEVLDKAIQLIEEKRNG